MTSCLRKLYINCDDLGLHPAIDEAILDLLCLDFPLSASLMIVGPSRDQAVSGLKALGRSRVGAHLTVTAEYPTLPMEPISGAAAVPSLVDERGFFHRSVEELREKAKLDDLHLELENQLKAFFLMDLEPTHLDGHVFFYQTEEMGPAVSALVADLADRYALPCRNTASSKRKSPPQPYMIWEGFDSLESRFAYYDRFCEECTSELSELILHPGTFAAAMKSFTKAGLRREADYRYFKTEENRTRYLDAFELCEWSAR